MDSVVSVLLCGVLFIDLSSYHPRPSDEETQEQNYSSAFKNYISVCCNSRSEERKSMLVTNIILIGRLVAITKYK